MGTAYGQSGQGGHITIGAIGPLKCTTIKLRKSFHNSDTTVGDDGWGKLCPIYRDWIIDVEMPCRSADGSDLIDTAFDATLFGNVQDVTLPAIVFVLPNGRTYSGYGALDGDVETTEPAASHVTLKFSIKGSGDLVATGG